MTTLHIELDEAVAAAIRVNAQGAGKTPEAYAAEIVSEQVGADDTREALRDFLESSRKYPGNSGGWKFNREELYER